MKTIKENIKQIIFGLLNGFGVIFFAMVLQVPLPSQTVDPKPRNQIEHMFFEPITETEKHSAKSYEFIKKEALQKAITCIENGRYDTARKLLNEYLKEEPEDKEALYYTGLNQLQLGNYAAAISKLQIAKKARNIKIRDNARYYFALCALAFEDNDLAISEFNKIANDNTSEYQEVAKSILADMNIQDEIL